MACVTYVGTIWTIASGAIHILICCVCYIECSVDMEPLEATVERSTLYFRWYATFKCEVEIIGYKP